MGKRSYAVVSEKMKEHMGRYPTRAELFEECCNPSDGSRMSEAVREAIIMGKDKDGRLRMYGMGVKPADIYGGKLSRDTLYRKLMEEKEEIRALKEKVEELIAFMHSRSHSERAQFSSSNNQSSSGISRPTRIRVGAYVKLRSLANFNETVAIGILRAISGVILNGRELGPNICEVVIQSILNGEEMLIYPLDLMKSIGDSIGAPIAWPLSLIEPEDNEN